MKNKSIMLRPVTSEKAVRMIELDNILIFEIDRRSKKADIIKAVSEIFSVTVQSVNTHIRQNKKFAYVKLAKNNLAIDVATKLGMI